jgi:uncharacterized iron-regulated protein
MIYRASRLLLTITLILFGYCHPGVMGKLIMDEPKPAKAVEGLIGLFDRFPIVALGEMHWNRTQHDFIVSLIEHPTFPDKVNDIVVEFGSAKYQNMMDKYIAGETVPHMELRQAWRNTTSPTTAWDVPLYERFFATVRAVNQKLPKAKKLRVLLGDPPIDWYAAKSSDDLTPFLARDDHFASVIEKEVLGKGRKALLIAGVFHLYRCCPAASAPINVTVQIDKLRPGAVFVVMPHHGFDERSDELEARLSSWPKPGIAHVKNTWLGELDPDVVYPVSKMLIEHRPDGTSGPAKRPYGELKFQDITDAFLYLGPRASLVWDMVPPEVEKDEEYKRELDRRKKLLRKRD